MVECLGCLLWAGPPPNHWARRHHCQMRHSDLSSESPCIQRSRAQKPAYLKVLYEICLYTHMDKGVAPAAWAIVLLVPPPPQGLPSQCNRHRCEREGQSLLFLQRPPPTHRSRRAPCQMRMSDFSSVQAAHVRTGRAVSAIRSKTTAHSLLRRRNP